MQRPNCACFAAEPDVGDKMLDILGSSLSDAFSQCIDLGERQDEGWSICHEAEEYALSVCVIGLVAIVAAAQLRRENKDLGQQEVLLSRIDALMENKLPALLRNRMEVVRHQNGQRLAVRH